MPAEEKIILRDYLAIDRTKLANQRTLLSYLRTAIMVLASGITVIKLIPESYYFQLVGFALIILVIPCLLIGLVSYRHVKKNISKMYYFED